MPVTLANTYKGAPTAGSTVDCSVTRASGEAIVIGYFWEYGYGTPQEVSSAVWDTAGDNQAMTLVHSLVMNNERRFEVYELKAPTSAKTGNVRFTHSGGGTTPDNVAYIAALISGYDDTTYIRAAAERVESAPETNDLPGTVTSASGDLVLQFAGVRLDATELGAGDADNYQEQAAATYNTRCVLFGTKTASGASTTITFGYDNASPIDNSIITLSVAPGAASQALSGSASTSGIGTSPPGISVNI